MGTAGWLERLSALGSAAQAMVPGLYAWGVTVAPCAWANGASGAAKLSSAASLAALLVGPLAGDRLRGRLRVPLLWTFLLGSALTWSTAPTALSSARIDTQRALAGVLGWALFATTWSAPALRVQPGARHVIENDPQPMGQGAHRTDRLNILGGAMLAALLQEPGWASGGLERALLVRLVALAAGLSVVGAATEFAVCARPIRRLLPFARVQPTDLLATALLVGAAAAFWLGEAALARAEDLHAVYWLVVGVVAVRACVRVVRRGAPGEKA